MIDFSEDDEGVYCGGGASPPRATAHPAKSLAVKPRLLRNALRTARSN